MAKIRSADLQLLAAKDPKYTFANENDFGLTITIRC
jgi:hypothetical protein